MSGSSLIAGIAAAMPASRAVNHDSGFFSGSNPNIIDTNINLFKWPFRRMKYGETKSLVAKLRHHRITEAWAGNFEALFSKSINEVNARLAEECRVNGEGVLIPFWHSQSGLAHATSMGADPKDCCYKKCCMEKYICNPSIGEKYC